MLVIVDRLLSLVWVLLFFGLRRFVGSHLALVPVVEASSQKLGCEIQQS